MLGGFEKAIPFILREEGGNDDDPDDPGGRTSRGITQKEWDVFRQANPGRPADVWQASDADVRTIYRTQYWSQNCDAMPAGFDLELFDVNVNSGPQRAMQMLQQCLGVGADGHFGMITKDALATADVPTLINAYSDRRRTFYKTRKLFWKFGGGWLSRVDHIQVAAIRMAANVTAPVTATPIEHVSAKADPADTHQPIVSPETSGGVTTGTTILAGITDQMQQATVSLIPYQSQINMVKYILLAFAVAGVGLAIYGIISRARTAKAMAA